MHKPSTVAVRMHLTIALFSNTLIPMDIQHSDIGCNKHQAIPAFQSVPPTLTLKNKKKILNYNFRWTTVCKEDEMMGNSFCKEDGGEYNNVAL